MLRTMVTSLVFLFLSFKSLAGDYKVDYAIDMRGVAESEEAAECSYGRSCMLKFKDTHVSIFLIAHVAKGHYFWASIYGGEGGCCYFYDGDNTTNFEYSWFDKYKKLGIYEGRRRHGNEYIFNKRVGTLFLVFKDFR